MAAPSKLLRPCPRCLPPLTDEDHARGVTKRGRADFVRTYLPVSGEPNAVEYECTNCGEKILYRPRGPRGPGGERQKGAVSRVHEYAAKAGWQVEEKVDEHSPGVIYLRLVSPVWFQETLFVRVGAAGAIEVSWFESGHAKQRTKKGFRAWIAIDTRCYAVKKSPEAS